MKMTWLKITTTAALILNAFLAQQRVASHFDIHGRPDAWMSPHRYLLVSLLIGVGLPLFLIAIGYFVRFLPATRVTFKIPNPDYWLTPDRRSEVDGILFHFCLWVACLEAVFLLILHLLVIYANRLTPPHFPTSVALVLGSGLIVAVGIRLTMMVRYFKQNAVAQ